MEQNIIKCKCNNKFKESEFKSHFAKCPQFKEHFSNFDYKLSELIKTYSEPKENLILINYLLKLYVVVVEKKIKESFPIEVNLPLNMLSRHSIESQKETCASIILPRFLFK